MRRFVAFLLGWLAVSAALAQTPNQNILRMNGGPSWILEGANIADLYFANWQYYTPGATGPQVNTRASAESCFDASGNLDQAVSRQNCVTNLGVSSWEGRTNSIRNNTMHGAVVGTPGTLPTNWAAASPDGLTTSVLLLPATNNLSCIEINIEGTTSGTNYALESDSTTTVAALYGQTWSLGGMFAFTGGSETNITSFAHRIRGYTSGGVTNDASAGNNHLSQLTSSIQSFQESYTVSSGTAYVIDQVLIGTNSGSAVNFTFEECVPQLELNPNIPSSVASATSTL